MTAKENEEFIILKQDVKYIKSEVTEIKKNSKELNESMLLLTSKMFTDDLTGEKGFFEITKRHGVRLTKLENFKAVGYGIIMFIGILAGWWLKFKKQGS
tara:strand:+ start:1698 stop:1994 length:297 start_codon:yes stop_codon:yes gene_type:complete